MRSIRENLWFQPPTEFGSVSSSIASRSPEMSDSIAQNAVASASRHLVRSGCASAVSVSGEVASSMSYEKTLRSTPSIATSAPLGPSGTPYEACRTQWVCNKRSNTPSQILDFGFPFDSKSVVDALAGSAKPKGDVGSSSNMMGGTSGGELGAPEPGWARIASRRAETASGYCNTVVVVSISV